MWRVLASPTALEAQFRVSLQKPSYLLLLMIVMFAHGATIVQGQTPPELLLRKVVPLGPGGSIGEMYYNDATLAARGLSADIAAKVIEQSFKYQDKLWPSKVFLDGQVERDRTRLQYFVYLVEELGKNTGDLGHTSSSSTQPIAGAPASLPPGVRPCVSSIYLKTIARFMPEELFLHKFTFVVTHELSHCFQRTSIPHHEETIVSPQSDWLLEGQASWLARKFVMELYGTPGRYFQEHLKIHLRKNLFNLTNEASFFFGFLESPKGLNSAAGVMSFTTDRRMPSPVCTLRGDLSLFPGRRGNERPNCDKSESPYPAFVTAWFEGRGRKFEDVLSDYAVALASNDVLGAPSAEELTKIHVIAVGPGYEVSRRAVMAILPVAAVPLATLKLTTPELEPFGVGIYRLATKPEVNPIVCCYQIKGGNIGPKVRVQVVKQVLHTDPGQQRRRSRGIQNPVERNQLGDERISLIRLDSCRITIIRTANDEPNDGALAFLWVW